MIVTRYISATTCSDFEKHIPVNEKMGIKSSARSQKFIIIFYLYIIYIFHSHIFDKVGKNIGENIDITS